MTATSSPTTRRLRRSRTDRIGAGVAGGLGDYFGVDPVLFRVLFATAAFFGGAGVLAYLLAWAAIPDEATEHAAIDGWIRGLRRRRVPFWLVVAAAGFLFWLIAFSWWAPGPFVPVMIVVIILVAVLGRREQAPAAPVSLVKTPSESAGWAQDTREWVREARVAARARRRRALPLRIATLVGFVVAMVVCGLVDAAHGISVATYFWVALAVLGTGMIVGLAMRRASWTVAPLLLLAIMGTVAFAGTRAGLRDGIGQKEWKPVVRPAASYRLAFGQGVLDLRSLPALASPSHVRVDAAAGRIEIIAPSTLNMRVFANVRFGDVQVDGSTVPFGQHWHGVGVSRIIDPPATARGPLMTVDVHLSDGNVDVQHR